MKSRKLLLTAAAVSGLFTVASCSSATGSQSSSSAETVMCYGVNSCKGHGQCGGKVDSCSGKNGCDAKLSCSGKNSCKGKGLVKMSKKDCKAKGGQAAKS